jgi:hypothetical protein
MSTEVSQQAHTLEYCSTQLTAYCASCTHRITTKCSLMQGLSRVRNLMHAVSWCSRVV